VRTTEEKCVCVRETKRETANKSEKVKAKRYENIIKCNKIN
jgi:hypothetical protein